LFFTAKDGVHGQALWKSNGSRAGTVLVKDIRSCSVRHGKRPSHLTSVGRRLLFAANDGVHGKELWKSDGTRRGTALVKDIYPGTYDDVGDPRSSEPSYLTAVGDTLFFTADDGKHGRQLWKSNGTKAGTVLVKKVSGFEPLSYPQLTAVGGTLFFLANGTRGTDLWKSDGTKAGTVLVKTVNPGGEYSEGDYDPDHLTAAAGTLFFSADDDTHGTELWKSDGTKRGTVLVKDINTGGS
jgi:ELWxxDGT repeat protein